MTEPFFVTVAEAAKLLAMHRQAVYEMCYTGELESITIGRARRVVFEDLKRYVAEARARAEEEREQHGQERQRRG